MQQDNHVVLIGRKPLVHENLALLYLKAALEARGMCVAIVPLNNFDEISSAAAEVMRRNPIVVGLSITDATCAMLMLGLGEALEKREFQGHITCGGGWATLQRQWLLERYSWLNSVIRLDGEVVLPNLVQAVLNKSCVSGVAGVTVRSGDGAAVPLNSSIPMTIWPSRDDLPEMLGHRAASMIASRGCKGACEYCGPAALQQLERDEAKRLDMTYPCNNGRVRRRTVDDITDEMAYLYHQKDVRYFAFADEHLLPDSRNAAMAFVTTLHDKMNQKGIGPCGFGGQISSRLVTPELCSALAAAGMVRVHVGLDLTDDSAVFSRPPMTDKTFEAVRLMNEAGIPTTSNVLLLHPQATLASMSQTLQTVSALDVGHVEFGQMVAYAGTALAKQLGREGRLFGNPLRYHYRFDDPPMARFERLFVMLRAHGFGQYSIMNRLHEMASRLALAKRLGLRTSEHDEHNLKRYRDGAFQLAISAYTQAVHICETNQPVDVHGFTKVYQLGQKMIDRQLRQLESRIYANIACSPKPSSSFSTNAVSMLAMIAFSSVAACNNVQSVAGDTETETDTETSTVTEASELDSTDEFASSDSAEADAENESETDSETGFESNTDETSEGDTEDALPKCKSGSKAEAAAGIVLEDAVSEADECAGGRFLGPEDGATFESWSHVEAGAMRVSLLEYNDPAELKAFYDEMVAVLVANDIECFPDIGWFHGKRETEANDLADTIVDSCDDAYGIFFHDTVEVFAVVDENGYARLSETLLEKEMLSQETFDCVNRVLKDLEFPCLSGMALETQVYMTLE